MTKQELEEYRSHGMLLDKRYEMLVSENDVPLGAKTGTPTIAFKGKAPDKIAINKKMLIEFIISGYPRLLRNNLVVNLISQNPDIEFSTTKWSGQDFGWTIKTNVIAKKEGTYTFQFNVNGKPANALCLVFYDAKREEEEARCICKKASWTADELKYIVTELRKREVYLKNGRVIRDENKKIIDREDITYYDDTINTNTKEKMEDKIFYLKRKERLDDQYTNYSEFSKQLNRIFKLYGINSCIRKIHFLAQIYQETMRFTATYEETSAKYSGGNFYQGRGLQQITHDYNYLEYYCFINKSNLFDVYMKNRKDESYIKNGEKIIKYESVVDFKSRTKEQYISNDEMDKVDELVSKISTDMYYACDSAGWYWWKNNINEYADKDDIIGVSAKVNNPSAVKTASSDRINGYKARNKFYLILKDIFNYETCK